MLACKDVTRLLSERVDRPLGRRERFGIWLHLWICKGCARYDRQMKFISDACRQFVARQKNDKP